MPSDVADREDGQASRTSSGAFQSPKLNELVRRGARGENAHHYGGGAPTAAALIRAATSRMTGFGTSG
jgi:hypothetical protein